MNTSDDISSPSAVRQYDLSNAAIGAVVALVHVADLSNPAVAHRSALRAIVAKRLFEEYTSASLNTPSFSSESEAGASHVVATAALSDIDLTVSGSTAALSPNEHTHSLLGSTIVSRLEGLDAVDVALEQLRERWDGKGLPNGLRGTDIVLAARISAVADSLVGNPTAGFIPAWHHARRRVRRQAGTGLDPSLCRVLDRVDLDSISSPAIPSMAVQELLHQRPEVQRRDDATRTASTIRNAVSLAGQESELLELFATSALSTVRAAEIVILSSSPTQLDPEPVAVVSDGHLPALSASRLDDLFEFSTQAEVRAGTVITREDQETGSVFEVVTPISVEDNSWGALVATRRRSSPGFDDRDIADLEHISSEIADALAATDHWAEMEHMALRDQLTKLGNRHALYRSLDSIFLRPADERIDTALIMCDVDGLKAVNDSLGHEAGDRLLMDAADALRGAVRDPERTTVCRIGGDEFCMVIDGGALLNVHEVSNTIERLFARSGGSGQVRSISCGIAFADDTTRTRSELLRAADENQYETKRARKAVQLRDAEQSRDADVDLRALPGDSTEADPGNRRARRD